MVTKQKEFVTAPELKKRGWTDSLIRDYLGEPDALRPNPHYRSAAPMRLYRLQRVEDVEGSEPWAALKQSAALRKASAMNAVQTKRQKLMVYLESLEVTVPLLPEAKLLQKACQHYNNRRQDRDEWDYPYYNGREGRDERDYPPASPDSDPAFLMRITVNYLRHGLSRYEEELDAVFGKVGVREAYIEINRKVYSAIGEAYPTLAEECRRQLDLKIERHQMQQEPR